MCGDTNGMPLDVNSNKCIARFDQRASLLQHLIHARDYSVAIMNELHERMCILNHFVLLFFQLLRGANRCVRLHRIWLVFVWRVRFLSFRFFAFSLFRFFTFSGKLQSSEWSTLHSNAFIFSCISQMLDVKVDSNLGLGIHHYHHDHHHYRLFGLTYGRLWCTCNTCNTVGAMCRVRWFDLILLAID